MTRTVTRQERRQDISGELLPPLNGRELVPYEERPMERIPAPLVHIALPAPRPDGAAPLIETERRTPIRAPNAVSDVAVPGLQAFITGIAGAIVTGVIAWALGWPARTVLIVAGLVMAAAWLWRLRWADGLIWQVETWTGFDLDNDRHIGAPHPPIVVNPLQAQADAHRTVQADNAASERDELARFLHRCYVAGTSERAHGVKAGSGADREKYTAHRDVLLALGIASWRNQAKPNAGWKLAVSYQRALELLAKHTL